MNMKKFMSLLICITLCLGLCSTATAAEPETSDTVTYDLEQGGSQNFTLTDSTGNLIYITISKSNIKSVANNTYEVSCTSPGNWRAGYKVTVYNNKITKLSAPHVTPLTGSILNKSLLLESNTQGTLYFTWKAMIFTHTKGVRTTLTSNTLKVYIV